jgi:branched-chain amino acid transport system permease protein
VIFRERTPSGVSNLEVFLLCALVSVILITPVFFSYYEGLVLDIIIMGVFALAYNLAFGHAGVVSVGHGVFFGLAGYIAGILMTRWYSHIVSIMLGLSFATAVGFATALAMFARLKIGTSAITKVLFVVIFTLGECYIVYHLFLSPLRAYSGGSNGLGDILSQPLQLVDGVSIDLLSPMTMYYSVTIIGVMSIAAMRWITYSPFANVVHSIREDEIRAAFLGHNVFLVKVLIFTLSAFFSGIAGVLFIARYGVIDLSVFQFTFIVQTIAVCLIGGRKTFYGPLVGTAVYCTARDFLIYYTSTWLLFVALLLVILVVIMPEGLAKVIKLK